MANLRDLRFYPTKAENTTALNLANTAVALDGDPFGLRVSGHGNAMTGKIDMAGKAIWDLQLNGYQEWFDPEASAAMVGTQSNSVMGMVVTGAITLAEPSKMNNANDQSLSSFTFVVKNAGTNITWWTPLVWANSEEPELSTSGIDVLTFVYIPWGYSGSGGGPGYGYTETSTWYGFLSGLNFGIAP